MNRILHAGVAILLGVGILKGEDQTGGPRIKAPAGWKEETISLPPSFAPTMSFKGTEVVRFAPGMFNAKSNSFFSYVFVFQIEPGQELTRKVLQQQMLVYYRGLAEAVLKTRKIEVGAKSFTLKLEAAKANAVDAKTYSGDLKWLEPFVTRKPQTLHLEMTTWQDTKSKRDYLFVCASPAKTTAAIWKQMRGLRKAYLQSQ